MKKLFSIIGSIVFAVGVTPPVFAAPEITDATVAANRLPAGLVGDTSDWVRIATDGDYSLIVRCDTLKDGITSKPISISFSGSSSGSCLGSDDDEDLTECKPFSFEEDAPQSSLLWSTIDTSDEISYRGYASSRAATAVDDWYRTLPSYSRLVQFAASSDAIDKLGSSELLEEKVVLSASASSSSSDSDIDGAKWYLCKHPGFSVIANDDEDGFSSPLGLIQSQTSDTACPAFLLSRQEAYKFCSKHVSLYSGLGSTSDFSDLDNDKFANNWNSLNDTDKSWWLRTGGYSDGAASVVKGSSGTISTFPCTNSASLRPAMWIYSQIFEGIA